MSYFVLECKKKGSRNVKEYSFAPHGWVDEINCIVYWPRSGMLTKRKFENNSVFESDWIPQLIYKILHKSISFEEADELVEHYLNKASETETESEYEKQSMGRAERLKKRLAPQLTSLPCIKQYKLSNPDNGFTVSEETVTEENILTDQEYLQVSVPYVIEPEVYKTTTEEPILLSESFDPINAIVDQQKCSCANDIEDISTSIYKMQQDLDSLKLTITGFGEILSSILSNTNSVYKYITEYLKNCSKSNDDEVLEKREEEEDFTDLQELKIKSTDELQDFEKLLEDKSYQLRFIKYLKTKFKMNGYENGQTFFTVVIRLLTEPVLFLPYSWKGINRKDTVNISFEGKHKTFIAFMFRIVRMADHTKVQTDLEKMFENLLRFKKILNDRPQTSRVPSSRCRPKGIKFKSDTSNEQINE